jgi:hypothetical protein
MGFYRGPNIVTDGLVFAVDAGSGRSYPGSGTTTTSLVGSNTGTLTNGVGFNSGNGGYWDFDGVDDYITVGGISTITSNLVTVCTWVKRDADGWIGALFGFGTEQLNTQDIYFWGTEGSRQFGFNTWNSDSWGFTGSTDAGEIMDGEWHYLTAVFNRSNITSSLIYVDGVSKSLSQVKGATQTRTPSTNFGIGINGWYTSGQLLNGNLSNTLIYNKQLTQAEITQNFNAQKSRFGL